MRTSVSTQRRPHDWAPAATTKPEIAATARPVPLRRGLPGIITACLTGGALLLGLLFGGVIGNATNDHSAETAELTAAVGTLQTKLYSTSDGRRVGSTRRSDTARRRIGS